MAERYWNIGYHMGYAGTKSEEKVDVCKFLGYTEEEVQEMENDELMDKLAQIAYEMACEKVDAWAEPISNL